MLMLGVSEAVIRLSPFKIRRASNICASERPKTDFAMLWRSSTSRLLCVFKEISPSLTNRTRTATRHGGHGGVLQKLRTGQGCLIEAPMFEGLTSFIMVEHLAGEAFRPLKGQWDTRRSCPSIENSTPRKTATLRSCRIAHSLSAATGRRIRSLFRRRQVAANKILTPEANLGGFEA